MLLLPLHCALLVLKCGRSGDDLNKLRRNATLTRAVVLEGEGVDHLAGVLRRVLHGGHARGLLGGGALHERVVQLRAQQVLGEAGERRGG